MSREICPDCVNTPCQCFENELKKLSDDMTLSADPLGRIKDLQSRLTAAETRIKELETTVEKVDRFIYDITLKLQQHRSAELSEKDEWFQEAYRLYAERNADRFDPAYEGRAELDKLKGKL